MTERAPHRGDTRQPTLCDHFEHPSPVLRVVTAHDVARVEDHGIEALLNPSADFLFGEILCPYITDCRQAASLLRRFGNCRMAQTVGVPRRGVNQLADLPMQASADDVARTRNVDLF